MTAETFSGARALEFGLVTEVADDLAAAHKAAEALAAELSARSPDALAATKTLLHRTWSRAPRWAFWTETVLQTRLLAGADFLRAGAPRDRPIEQGGSLGPRGQAPSSRPARALRPRPHRVLGRH
jgi:enoyl-CoA hydratase/carnithine racemase